MTEFRIEKIPSQKGKICIITGSNTGLGYEAAKALAGKGMKVIMACRDKGKAGGARDRILKEYPASEIEIMLIDLSSLSSVRNFVRSFLTNHTRLDLLINNAGIMMTPYSKTEDGFESQIGVNYFSHFLLTGLLFNIIANTPGSRIVTLASIAHKKATIRFKDLNWEKKYQPLQAYRQSKLACLIFAFELQRRIERAGLRTLSVAAHPGMSITELVRHIPKWLMFIGRPLTSLATHSPEKGVLPVLWAALGSDVRGGDYYGPQGYGEWTGKPGKAISTPLSHDEETGRRLWDLSEQLTGIKYPV